MESKIFEEFELVSPKDEIKHFIKDNENTIEILNAIKPQLHKHFPNVCFLFGEANYIFVSLICGFASIVNLPI